MKKCYIYGFVIFKFIHVITADEHIVSTADGDILGRESVTPNGKSFLIFQGVPYAAPPLGNLRFTDPQEPAKWTDVKNCTNKNIICLQIAKDTTEFEAEDCLVLNIYTPKQLKALLGTSLVCFQLAQGSNESNLAVMVYFFGGGFYKGNISYDSYGPEFFMDRDVVVVMVNYRLGAFGFLSTGDGVISGNFGLKDQQLGLKWVQKNIRAFGGNPDKVTIFGNSAGSASVGLHILNKKNIGLFRGGIMSSGTPLGVWTFQKHPKKVAHATAVLINNSKTIESSEELLQFLRSVPASDLRKASFDLKNSDPFGYKEWLHGYYYAPTLESENENGFLVNHAYNSLEFGEFIHVPLMMGINSEEQLDMIGDGDNFINLMRSYDHDNGLLVSDQLNIDNVTLKEEVGKLIHNIYCENNISLVNSLDRGIRFFSDQKMNVGIIKHAYFASKYTDIFFYQFSHHGLMGNNLNHVNGGEEVAHAEDNNYIWRRNLPNANNTNLDIFPKSDLLVQNRLLDLYTNFAKYLNPTIRNDPLLQNISWPTVNPEHPNDFTYLDIGNNLELKTKIKADTFWKWDELFMKYAVKPYNTY